MPGYQLSIRDLIVETLIGIYPEERLQKTPITWSLDLSFKQLSLACSTDEIKDAVCYATVCEELIAISTAQYYCLIEHLGARALEYLQKKYTETNITLTLSKPIKLGNTKFNVSCTFNNT